MPNTPDDMSVSRAPQRGWAMKPCVSYSAPVCVPPLWSTMYVDPDLSEDVIRIIAERAVRLGCLDVVLADPAFSPVWVRCVL